MVQILIVGDGPAGLSAALLLAKRQQAVRVFGLNKTPMHTALLRNYLGLPSITGTRFQALARQQVRDVGAELVEQEVVAAHRREAGFRLHTADGQCHEGDYLILASGPVPKLAQQVGLSLADANSVQADTHGRTEVDRLYAVGWAARPQKIQAIIAAGDGAAAALDILSREAGQDVHDFDTVT